MRCGGLIPAGLVLSCVDVTNRDGGGRGQGRGRRFLGDGRIPPPSLARPFLLVDLFFYFLAVWGGIYDE